MDNEILVKIDLRSGPGIDSSRYMKHEVFAIIDTRERGWRTGTLYINSEQWSGWVFEGDGTSKAEARATLWGLAELVTGNGQNWKKIEGYSGDAEKMPIGQIVNYLKLTRVVPVRIFIVKSSGHTEISVKEHIKKAVKILNPQQVAVLLDYTIEEIEDRSTTGIDLLNISLGLNEEEPDDIAYNLDLKSKIGKGIVARNGEEVDLFDDSGNTFFQLYTNEIRERGGQRSNTLGFAFYRLTTAILANGLSDNTLAHELCHNFGLPHMNDLNNLMYENGSIRRNSYLEHSQVAAIKEYLKNYPHAFRYP